MVGPARLSLFAPYCGGLSRGPLLSEALALLEQGELRGERRLRPEGVRPFQLQWQPAPSPLEATALQLHCNGAPHTEALTYALALPTYQLVLWLMDWLAAGGSLGQPADLPASFWQWLLVGTAPPAASA